MSDYLPYALPDIGEEEIAEVVDSLRSGWLTSGPKTKQFEQDFAAFMGSEVEAIAVNSATAGLHLALEALGIGPGDEVITTTFTFTATAGVVKHLGAVPVLVDIDPETLNIDVNKIESAITERTRAIIPVHFAGLPCEMDRIVQIARKYGLKVVEDAAHALPAIFNKRLIGTLDTDATVFSFYATKTITTGEGGMIVTRNPLLAERCRVMRLHGIDRDAFNRYRSSKPSWYYEIIAPGFKYNLTDIASAIGIQQLKKALDFQHRRSEMAAIYDSELKDLPLIMPPRPGSHGNHSWHLYVVRLDDDVSVSRDKFINRMSAHGIGCSVHFIPLHLHPYWQEELQSGPEDFPHALRAWLKAVSIPLYTRMTESDQLRVIDAIRHSLSISSSEAPANLQVT